MIMSHRVFNLLFLVALACLLTLTFRLVLIEPRSVVVLEEEVIHISATNAGDLLRVPIRISNRSRALARITNIFAACGCTRLENESGERTQFPSDVQANSTRVIYAVVDTAHQKGDTRVQTGIEIQPQMSPLLADIQYKVIPGAQLSSTLVDVDLAVSNCGALFLGSYRSLNPSIEKITAYSPFIQTKVSQVTPEAKQVDGPYDEWIAKSRIDICMADEKEAVGSHFIDVFHDGQIEPLSFTLRVFDSRILVVEPRTVVIEKAPTIRLISFSGLAKNCTIQLDDRYAKLELIGRETNRCAYNLTICRIWITDEPIIETVHAWISRTSKPNGHVADDTSPIVDLVCLHACTRSREPPDAMKSRTPSQVRASIAKGIFLKRARTNQTLNRTHLLLGQVGIYLAPSAGRKK